MLYQRSGTKVAVGYLDTERRLIHGKPIPAGYRAVQLTWVQSSEIPSPLILGHPEENAILRVGQFFALPVADLSLAKLV